jgi:hypothetical protein
VSKKDLEKGNKSWLELIDPLSLHSALKKRQFFTKQIDYQTKESE